MLNKTIEILQEYEKTSATAYSHQKELTTKLSKTDVSINDILHIVEFANLPANKMSTLTKKLKTLYIIRREIKEELTILANVLQHNKKLSNEIVSSQLRVEKYKIESKQSLFNLFKDEQK